MQVDRRWDGRLLYIAHRNMAAVLASPVVSGVKSDEDAPWDFHVRFHCVLSSVTRSFASFFLSRARFGVDCLNLCAGQMCGHDWQSVLCSLEKSYAHTISGCPFPPQQKIATPGHGILAMDESNATCGKRLDSIGVENTEDNRRSYRELLVTTPGLGQYISGAILFEETLYQSAKSGKTFVECLKGQNIVPGIKVDKGLVPLPNSNGESWCQGLDGLAQRCAEYYKAGARFAKWRSVVSIPAGAHKHCSQVSARMA